MAKHHRHLGFELKKCGLNVRGVEREGDEVGEVLAGPGCPHHHVNPVGTGTVQFISKPLSLPSHFRSKHTFSKIFLL